MPQQSQEGHIGVKLQTDQTGTADHATAYDDPGAAGTGGEPHAGHFFKITSSGLSGSRELLIPDPEIGGSRDIQDARLGPISFAGDVEFYTRFDSVGSLIHYALGATTSTPSGTTFDVDMDGSHATTPVDAAASLPYFSIEEQVGAGYETFNYSNARVSALSLTADADGYCMGTMGVIAQYQDADNSATSTPTFDPSPLIAGVDITVKWDGVASGDAVAARDFSFELNNGIEDDVYQLGSPYVSSLTPKRREINLGFTLRPDDANEYWQEAVYGAVGATPGSASAVKKVCQIELTSNVNTPASNAYSITINVPNATIRPFTIDPSGDDVLEHTFEIIAFRPSLASPAVTITTNNRYPAIR